MKTVNEKGLAEFTAAQAAKKIDLLYDLETDRFTAAQAAKKIGEAADDSEDMFTAAQAAKKA